MTTSTTSDAFDSLSDRSVILSLQELAEDIIDPDPTRTPSDPDEAQALVNALLAADATSTSTPQIVAMPETECLQVARQLLAHLVQDPDTAIPAKKILLDPPAAEQMSVETAVNAAAVLGALIAWLQTKVDIKITRKQGKSEFEFRLTKNPTSTSILRDLAAVVARLFNGPPQ